MYPRLPYFLEELPHQEEVDKEARHAEVCPDLDEGIVYALPTETPFWESKIMHSVTKSHKWVLKHELESENQRMRAGSSFDGALVEAGSSPYIVDIDRRIDDLNRMLSGLGYPQ